MQHLSSWRVPKLFGVLSPTIKMQPLKAPCNINSTRQEVEHKNEVQAKLADTYLIIKQIFAVGETSQPRTNFLNYPTNLSHPRASKLL